MANKCKKVYESNIPWLMAACSGHESHTPEWQWQRARQAGMHGRRGKFPLRDGQWTGLGQALQQNVHFISGKVPGRTGPGQVLWGSRKANKSPSQGTIQVHLNQQTERRSKTTEVSSENWPERHKCLLHYSSGQVCLCMWHHLSRVNRKMGFQRYREM